MKGLSHVRKQRKSIHVTTLSFLYLFLAQPMILSADDEAPPFDRDYGGSTEYYIDLLEVFFVLAIVIVLIVLLVRFLANRNRSLMSTKAVKTLSGVQLGQNKSVQLIEIGNSIYVIGVGDNVELIEKIQSEEEVAEIKASLEQPNMLSQQGLASAGNWIRRLKNNMFGKYEEEEEEVSTSFQEVFKSKMSHVSERKKRIDELLIEENRKHRSSDS